MRQADVERLVTLTSGRDVAKTGVSLSAKETGMWLLDEFSSVETRFNPWNRKSSLGK